MKRTVAALYIISFLILLFGYTAISKLLDAAPLERVLRQVPFLKTGAAVTAILLPLAELLIVLLLFFRRTRLAGLYLSAGMLAAFILYLCWMVLYAPSLPCSCGGVIDTLGWKEHIAFNAVVLSLNIAAIRWTKHTASPTLSTT